MKKFVFSMQKMHDYKNQLGVFYPPKKIFIYDSFLLLT